MKKELTKYRMFKTFFVRIVDELKTMNNSEVNIADFMKRIKRGANMPINSLGRYEILNSSFKLQSLK